MRVVVPEMLRTPALANNIQESDMLWSDCKTSLDLIVKLVLNTLFLCPLFWYLYYFVFSILLLC